MKRDTFFSQQSIISWFSMFLHSYLHLLIKQNKLPCCVSVQRVVKMTWTALTFREASPVFTQIVLYFKKNSKIEEKFPKRRCKMYVTLNEWGDSKIRRDALTAFYLGSLIFIVIFCETVLQGNGINWSQKTNEYVRQQRGKMMRDEKLR